MSEYDSQLFKRYMALQSRIQKSLPSMDAELSKPEEAQIAYVVNSLKKVATPDEDLSTLNAAHIALNSKEIERMSENMMMAIEALSAAGQKTSTVRYLIGDIPAIHKEAKALIAEGENVATRTDISLETTDYLVTAYEAPIVAKELELAASELQGNDATENVSERPGIVQRLTNIVVSAANKTMNWMKRVSGRAKQYGEDLKTAIESIPEKITQAGSRLVDTMAPLLKNALDKLSQFMAALVGAMFDFAAWVQSIADKKGFTIKEFSLEIPSVEIEVMMVGPIPIPKPKFQTPKLSISFGEKGNTGS